MTANFFNPLQASTPDRIIKKYPNRRLYDTTTSTYITLTDIKGFVVAGEPCKVVEAKTDEDITRSVLLQIILEEEVSNTPLFSTPVLANIIRFYGNTMQGMMGNYLEKAFQSMANLQQKPMMDAMPNADIFAEFQGMLQKQTADLQQQAQAVQETVLSQMQQFFDVVQGKK